MLVKAVMMSGLGDILNLGAEALSEILAMTYLHPTPWTVNSGILDRFFLQSRVNRLNALLFVLNSRPAHRGGGGGTGGFLAF